MVPGPTPRLRFREMAETDLADMATLDTAGTRGARGWIAWNQASYAEHGFGLWVVETHAGEFVGDCGLTIQEVDGEQVVEAGWHVRRGLRRQGYASEAAEAVRGTAVTLGVTRLWAIIRPGNTASQRVATSIGLEVERTAWVHGGPALLYAAWLGGAPT